MIIYTKKKATKRDEHDSLYTGKNESNENESHAYEAMKREAYEDTVTEAAEYISELRSSGADEEKIYTEAVKLCKTTRDIAELLGTSQPTVVRRLKKYGLKTSK